MTRTPPRNGSNGQSPKNKACRSSDEPAVDRHSTEDHCETSKTMNSDDKSTTLTFQPDREAVVRVGRLRRRLAPAFFVLGVVVVAVLAWSGGDYYLLSFGDRVRDPRHDWLSPGGTWGHGLGIAATLLMLSNFFYFVRKRWRVLGRFGPVPLWLTVHVSSGLLSAVVILFHAAFRSRNLIATFSYFSLLVVVLTGLVGRYIYGLVPGTGGSEVSELERLKEQWRLHRDAIRQGMVQKGALHALAPQLAAPRLDAQGIGIKSALSATIGWTGRALSGHRALKRDLTQISVVELNAVGSHLRAMNLLRLQIELFHGLKTLLATWRLGHSLLATFLVVVIVLHVAWSLAFGFRWVF